MLLEAEDMEVGEIVEVVLTFEEAGQVVVSATVVEAHEVMSG